MLIRSTYTAWPALAALLMVLAPGCGGGSSNSGDGGDPDGSSSDGGLDGAGGDGSTSGDSGTGSDSGTGGDSGTSDAATDGSGFEPILLPDGGLVFPTNDAGQVLCGTEACLCSDGLDNDGDGLADGFDPECTGPYDNDENSFATGIPGDNRDDFQDCFFDGNSGGGSGDCMIASVCFIDRDGQECLDSFKGQRTLESEEMKCEDHCEPRTPNGCDCFGCCEVYTSDSESTHVLIDPECEVEIDADGHGVVGDSCQVCEPSSICGNECGECELCLGRTVDDLPDSCIPDSPDGGTPDAGSPEGGSPDSGEPPPPSYECLDGSGNPQPTCDPQTPCIDGAYCFNGCCVTVLI